MSKRALIATQCFPPRPGGIEALMHGLARALAGHGWAVEVHADTPGERVWTPGYVVRRHGGPKPLRRWWKARVIAAALAADARAGAERLVLADSWKSLERLPRAALRGHRVLCLAHGNELPEGCAPARRARIEASFAKAEIVVANSGFTARRVALFGDPRCVVVAPPATPAPDPSEEALAEMRARLDAGAAPVLATLARLEPLKGIDRTIEALARLPAAAPQPVYAIAGTGADLARLQALAETLGVSPRIRWLGWLDPMPRAALLSLTDLHVMPSRAEAGRVESYGMAHVDAGWFGAPAIAGNVGGQGDAVTHGETGLVIDGAEADTVAAAIAALLADPARRRAMGAAARAAARGHAWPEAAAAYLAPLGLPL